VGSRAKLIEDLQSYVDGIFAGESPFYGELTERMRDDVAAGGPSWELLAPYADEPRTEYFPLRALAGVHLEVLSGELPDLAGHYPSTGGDGDAAAAWPLVREALAARDPAVIAELRHPLQTNETSRCGALAGGFHLIAARSGLPMRILELGSSAGLNLHFDSYRYEAGGMAAGPADSPIRFVDYWRQGVPPLAAPIEVRERRGCDLAPIDSTTEAGRLELLSFVMPDDRARFETLEAAIGIARRRPVAVDRASADDWLDARLAEPAPEAAIVVFHSVFWIYPPQSVLDRILATLADAGGEATPDAPLHWLRYEGGDSVGQCDLRLTSWPGGDEELLGHGRYHYAPVTWLAGA